MSFEEFQSELAQRSSQWEQIAESVETPSLTPNQMADTRDDRAVTEREETP